MTRRGPGLSPGGADALGRVATCLAGSWGARGPRPVPGGQNAETLPFSVCGAGRWTMVLPCPATGKNPKARNVTRCGHNTWRYFLPDSPHMSLSLKLSVCFHPNGGPGVLSRAPEKEPSGLSAWLWQAGPHHAAHRGSPAGLPPGWGLEALGSLCSVKLKPPTASSPPSSSSPQPPTVTPPGRLPNLRP